jgi:hypothetical protein
MSVEVEDQNQEQNQEQEAAFTFKTVESSSENIIPESDVVEIPEEPINIPAPAETQPEEEEEEEEDEEENEEVYELNEELAYNFLKEKKGLESDSLEDFLQSKGKKNIDPEIEKYLEYKAKTGRGYSDFVETQKDWNGESEEALVKAGLKLQNPNLSNEDIDFIFERDYSFNADVDDDFDVKSKIINLKIESKKALDLLNKQKEDYFVVRGSDEENVPEVYKEAKTLIDELYDEQTENERIAKTRRDAFISRTESVLNEKFEGFKFNVEGQEFTVKPEDIKATKAAQLNIANFQQKFFDKDENLIDPEGYHRSLFAAMDPEKLAKHFFNLGKTSYAESLERESKNIDVTGNKHIPAPDLGGFTFKKA